jgi:hypothetical protein
MVNIVVYTHVAYARTYVLIYIYTTFTMIGDFKNRPTKLIQWWRNREYWEVGSTK